MVDTIVLVRYHRRMYMYSIGNVKQWRKHGSKGRGGSMYNQLRKYIIVVRALANLVVCST
jgi:hypothetical protein